MTNAIYEAPKETAKKIRAELKKAFPGVKFSVKTKRYSMGSSISVSWTDGPMDKEVSAITDKFESAGFDSYQDMKTYKTYTYEGKEYRGADYVFTTRTLSPEYRAVIHAEMKKQYANYESCETERDFYNVNDYHYWFNKVESDLKTPATEAPQSDNIIQFPTAKNEGLKVVDNRGEQQGRGYNVGVVQLTPEQETAAKQIAEFIQSNQIDVQSPDILFDVIIGYLKKQIEMGRMIMDASANDKIKFNQIIYDLLGA